MAAYLLFKHTFFFIYLLFIAIIIMSVRFFLKSLRHVIIISNVFLRFKHSLSLIHYNASEQIIRKLSKLSSISKKHYCNKCLLNIVSK